jgi:hypothetical protein
MNTLVSTLQRSEGYCDLGMWREAQNELETLSPTVRSHPDVIWRELKILVGQKLWLRAARVGLSLCASWPERAAFFLETTFVLEQAGEISEGLSLLRSAPAHVWNHAEAWYSLACINARMAEVEASRMALGRCFEIDQNWKFTAMYEPALATLSQGSLPA